VNKSNNESFVSDIKEILNAAHRRRTKSRDRTRKIEPETTIREKKLFDSITLTTITNILV